MTYEDWQRAARPHGVGFRITEVWAFLAVHDDDDEGIIGELMGLTWMPFVAADPHRIEDLMPRAQAIARETGKTIRLVRFSERTDIEIINQQPEREHHHGSTQGTSARRAGGTIQ